MMGSIFNPNLKSQIASNKLAVHQSLEQAQATKDQAFATQLEKEAVQANATAREKASELEQDAVEGLTEKADIIQGVQKESYSDVQERRDSFFNTKTKYKAANKRIKEIMG